MKRKKCLSTLLGASLMLLTFTSPNVVRAADNNSKAISTLNKKSSDKAQFDEQEIKLNTATGTIYGTITKAQKHDTGLVVLIIAGSGPTDRNCNSAITGISSDAYKMISYELAKNGISSVRYDKRGIGESSGAIKSEADLVFDDYINDAVDWVNMLRKDNGFSKVAILGHSEGSLIGMVAAERTKVDGFISVAGAGYSMYDTLKRQLESQPKEVYDECLRIMDELKKGNTVDNVDPGYYSLFRPSVQPYIISEFKYDPTVEIKNLKIPTLIIQGTTDLQVTVDDANRLKSASSNATINIIDGMNHVLKDAPIDSEKNLETYKNPNLPLAHSFRKDLIKFIKHNFK